ncbi:MAG: hypothetical protein V1493_00925, partial [Candidatus Diapherotrites archaeon]
AYAEDRGIRIYTVGFGTDINTEVLEDIADITDANYYLASDENALKAIYDTIIIEIGNILEEGVSRAYDASVTIELPKGAAITQSVPAYDGITEIGDANFLEYTIGNMTPANPWTAQIIMHIPCNNDASCSLTDLNIPGENSHFNYSDKDGITQAPIPWPDIKTILFKYRDLAISILSGQVVHLGLVRLDLNVANTGLLDTGPSDINFYWQSQAPENLIDTRPVPGLLPGQVLLNQYDLGKEGLIIAVINDDGSVKECPNGNIASIDCKSGVKVEYYQLKVQVWRR